jgi:DNA polymerase-3 subunit epsilon
MHIGGLDIETTGLEWGEHRIVEVALLIYGEEGALRTKAVQRIDPQRSIQAKAQAVHGIALEMLVGCPTWEVVGPKFARLLDRCDLIVAHNGEDFDGPFVNHELQRLGLPAMRAPIFDTMKSARWATPLGKLPSLQELCFACDVPYNPDQAHAAEYDVDRMMGCFFRGLDWGRFTLPSPAEALPDAA